MDFLGELGLGKDLWSSYLSGIWFFMRIKLYFGSDVVVKLVKALLGIAVSSIRDLRIESCLPFQSSFLLMCGGWPKYLGFCHQQGRPGPRLQKVSGFGLAETGVWEMNQSIEIPVSLPFFDPPSPGPYSLSFCLSNNKTEKQKQIPFCVPLIIHSYLIQISHFFLISICIVTPCS